MHKPSSSPTGSHSDPATTMLARIRHALRFYWDGTKQYGSNTKYSCVLLWRRAQGHELTRPQYRHLLVSRRGALRLVPFSVFVIVPFLEVLLPVALYFFPTMLPSTYEDVEHRKERHLKLTMKRKEWSENINRVTPSIRTLVQDFGSLGTNNNNNTVSQSEVSSPTMSASSLARARLFRHPDEFRLPILENLSDVQLYYLARYTVRFLPLRRHTPRRVLLVVLRRFFRELHRDDILLAAWKVDTLTLGELEEACVERGILYDVDPHAKNSSPTRSRLHDWVTWSAADPTLSTTISLYLRTAMSIPLRDSG